MALALNISANFRVKAIKALVMLLAVPLLSMLTPSEAKANVFCSVQSSGLDFGTSSTGAGSVNYNCTNWDSIPRTFTLCVKLGNASWPGSNNKPAMQGNGNSLRFNVYRDAALGQKWKKNDPLTQTVTIPAGNGVSVTGSFSFYGQIVAGQNPSPANYQAFFYNTRLGFIKNNGKCASNWNNQGLSALQFTLQINATISNDCTVDALADLDLGTVVASASPVSSYTKIEVECPNGTPYTIGLRPSNGNSAGQGVMGGTGGNTDQLPYSLHSSSGSGPIWGNTASIGNVGNGVSGTGNGNGQTYGVYATVPDTQYTADTYSDTVLITVHF